MEAAHPAAPVVPPPPPAPIQARRMGAAETGTPLAVVHHLFGGVDQRFEVRDVEEPDLERADPELAGEEGKVSVPVPGMPSGSDGTVGSGASCAFSASADSAIDPSISTRSKSAFPSRMSSNGTSRPSRRQISQASTHMAFADPAARSDCHSAYRRS